jgi:hypothetical protein
LGIGVEMVRPLIHLPIFTATRLLFNEALRWRDFDADATMGIDADGYAMAGKRNSPPHIACVKGVIGDAGRFETGITRASLAFHSRLEAKNARRADLVITISLLCSRIEELYGISGAAVVPELIDLKAWRQIFSQPCSAGPGQVHRAVRMPLLPRKVEILLRAPRNCVQRFHSSRFESWATGRSIRLRRICAECASMTSCTGSEMCRS